MVPVTGKVGAHGGGEPTANIRQMLPALLAMELGAAPDTAGEIVQAFLLFPRPVLQKARRKLGRTLQILFVMNFGIGLERARQALAKRVELLPRERQQVVRARQCARRGAQFSAPRFQSASPARKLPPRQRIDLAE